jgi:putative oxidoreductase
MTATLTAHAPKVLALLRIVTGLLFLHHGTQKLFDLPPMDPAMAAEMGAMVSILGVVEVVGGLAIMAGFLTRPVAFVLSGMMAAAYFIAHAPMSPYPSANFGEAAIFFSFVFLYLVFAGPGAWSVDGARAAD